MSTNATKNENRPLAPVWAVLAGLLAAAPLGAVELVDDFTVDPDPFDEDPVCWAVPSCCPGEYTSGDGSFCVVSPNTTSAGLATCDVFSGDVRVRIRASTLRPETDLTVFAHGNNTAGLSLYIAGIEFRSSGPEVFLSRWESGTRLNREHVLLPGFAADPLADEITVELTVKLTEAGRNRIEVRVWPAAEEPPSPQLDWTDPHPPYRSGVAGFASRAACFFEARITELEPSAPPVSFLRADCNDDGAVNITDAVFVLGFLFLGEDDPGCMDACDSNDDGALNITDAVTTLNKLFLGQGSIPPPGIERCGADPTKEQSELGCEEYESCPEG